MQIRPQTDARRAAARERHQRDLDADARAYLARNRNKKAKPSQPVDPDWKRPVAPGPDWSFYPVAPPPAPGPALAPAPVVIVEAPPVRQRVRTLLT